MSWIQAKSVSLVSVFSVFSVCIYCESTPNRKPFEDGRVVDIPSEMWCPDRWDNGPGLRQAIRRRSHHRVPCWVFRMTGCPPSGDGGTANLELFAPRAGIRRTRVPVSFSQHARGSGSEAASRWDLTRAELHCIHEAARMPARSRCQT